MEEQNKEQEIKTVITSSTETIDKVITLAERLKGYIDKHGITGLFTTLLLLMLVSVAGYVIINPSFLFEQFEKFSYEKHSELLHHRMAADPQIRANLVEFRTTVNADRVFLMEPHNGSSNLSNLPFVYGDMTYAEPTTALTELESEYKNFRFSRFPLATKTFNDGYWFGCVDEKLKELDPEIYYKFKAENVTYMGMMTIYSNGTLPSGILGVVYTSADVPSEATIRREMRKYITVLSPLLSGETVHK